MSQTTLKKKYEETIVPALTKEFSYTTPMQVPRLEKIVINQGLGEATQDKKIIETAINELTAITGQKAVQTLSKKDISNFKVRKKMPIGVRVTLRREKMYEFLERLVRVALPRIRDFKGIESKLDGRGNYTLGITEQIIFPEINIDSISKLMGMNITFVTSANTDEEGFALLKQFGLLGVVDFPLPECGAAFTHLTAQGGGTFGVDFLCDIENLPGILGVASEMADSGVDIGA